MALTLRHLSLFGMLISTVTCHEGTVINVYTTVTPDSPINGKSSKVDKTKSTDVIAFSVGTRSRFSPGSTSRIPMDHVFYNKGGYFNMDTSIFTAPLAGVYSFYFGASGQPGKRIYIYLYAGNPEKSVATTYNYNTASHGHASGSVILEMKKGDQASMWLHSGMTIFEQTPPSTHFTGFLLYKLPDETD